MNDYPKFDYAGNETPDVPDYIEKVMATLGQALAMTVSAWADRKVTPAEIPAVRAHILHTISTLVGLLTKMESDAAHNGAPKGDEQSR